MSLPNVEVDILFEIYKNFFIAFYIEAIKNYKNFIKISLVLF